MIDDDLLEIAHLREIERAESRIWLLSHLETPVIAVLACWHKVCCIKIMSCSQQEEHLVAHTMNILLLDTQKEWVEDVQEAFQNLPITLYVADSQQEAHCILASHSIEMAVFALRTLADLEFLHELNTAYRQIEVILTVENPVSEIVTILKEGAYRIMEAPVRPSALKAYVETIKRPRSSR
jgi:response regulator RpfG family c-di-GMP phosphodiesterase